MNKFKKSQILVLTILALLLTVTPFLSPSVRSAYLYFVINFLIVALGAEAGLLSALSKPLEEKKQSLSSSQNSLMPTADKGTGTATTEKCHEEKAKVVEKSNSKKIASVAEMDKVRRCPSKPSLFFIEGGGAETEADEVDEENEAEEVGGINGQELFTKAEAFIGNFYKQLKIQREESWQRIHEIYQKAF